MVHTKGEWWVDVGDEETSVEAEAQTICTNVSNCDADLIAATPDMYEALKEAENFFILMKAYIPAHGRTLKLVQDSLAKADGGKK